MKIQTMQNQNGFLEANKGYTHHNSLKPITESENISNFVEKLRPGTSRLIDVFSLMCFLSLSAIPIHKNQILFFAVLSILHVKVSTSDSLFCA